jgi:hypothetical protein
MRLTRNQSRNSQELVQPLPLPTRRRSTRSKATAQDSNDDRAESVTSTQDEQSQLTESETDERCDRNKSAIRINQVPMISEENEQDDDDEEYEDDAVVGKATRPEEQEADSEPDHEFELPDDADEDAIEQKYADLSGSEEDSDMDELNGGQEDDSDDQDKNEDADDADDDDAPEEVSFSALKSQAVAEHQKKVQIERHMKESVKDKRRKMVERNAVQKKSVKRVNKSEPEAICTIKQKKVETKASKLSVIANQSTQINSVYFKHVKANAARNNRVMSFKDNAIMKRHVKRISANGYSRSLHKLQSLKY